MKYQNIKIFQNILGYFEISSLVKYNPKRPCLNLEMNPLVSSSTLDLISFLQLLGNHALSKLCTANVIVNVVVSKN